MNFDTPRAHFRILYPIHVRPLFTVDGVGYPVIDLSEGGMRCAIPGARPPQAGAALEGTLRFHRGVSNLVAGEVIRVDHTSMAVRFTVGVPFADVLEEQRFLLRRNRGMR